MWNGFFSPAAIATTNGYNTYYIDGEFQCHIQIYSKLCPEYQMMCPQESCFINYDKDEVTNYQRCIIFTMNINQINLWVHLILKQVIEAGFTGLNTRAGDLLTVKFKSGTPVAGGAVHAQRVANYMNIVFPSRGSYLGNP